MGGFLYKLKMLSQWIKAAIWTTVSRIPNTTIGLSNGWNMIRKKSTSFAFDWQQVLSYAFFQTGYDVSLFQKKFALDHDEGSTLV